MDSKNSRPKAQAPRKLSFWTFCTANGEMDAMKKSKILKDIKGSPGEQ
jgi:hypothetical protein